MYCNVHLSDPEIQLFIFKDFFISYSMLFLCRVPSFILDIFSCALEKRQGLGSQLL